MGGLRYNTQRTYTAAQRQYLNFCHKYGIPPIPADESVLLRYIAHMHSVPGRNSTSLSHNTMQVYLSAVRSLHVLSGYPPPALSTPRITLALKSVAAQGSQPVKKLAITYTFLCQLLSKLPQTYDAAVWRAALLLGYAGGLRGSEYTLFVDSSNNTVVHEPPRIDAVRFGNHEGMCYMVYKVVKSKTTIHPFYKYIACNSKVMCPVCQMYSYLCIRAAGRSLSPDAPLFQFSDGNPLTKQLLNAGIKSLVAGCGVDPTNYSSHSLRIGILSCGHAAGMSDQQLASLGNWRSDAF